MAPNFRACSAPRARSARKFSAGNAQSPPSMHALSVLALGCRPGCSFNPSRSGPLFFAHLRPNLTELSQQVALREPIPNGRRFFAGMVEEVERDADAVEF